MRRISNTAERLSENELATFKPPPPKKPKTAAKTAAKPAAKTVAKRQAPAAPAAAPAAAAESKSEDEELEEEPPPAQRRGSTSTGSGSRAAKLQRQWAIAHRSRIGHRAGGAARAAGELGGGSLLGLSRLINAVSSSAGLALEGLAAAPVVALRAAFRAAGS